MTDAFGTTITIAGSNALNVYGADGDSGGPVISDNGSANVYLYGLYFGWYRICNPTCTTYGLKPSSDGNYNLKFAALHETSVALPSGASIIYDHSTVCAEKNSPSRIYIYDITFKLG